MKLTLYSIFSSLAPPLQVISDYCKTHHQVKPFSHIVMDLFHDAVNQNDEDAVEAANGAEAEMNDGQRNMQKKKQQVDEKYETLFLVPFSLLRFAFQNIKLINSPVSSFFLLRSDTDSGRSSDHGSDQPLRQQQQQLRGLTQRGGSKKLEVHRMPTIKSAENSPAKMKTQPDVKKAPVVAQHRVPVENVLQVVRRKRRRETFRRNTIDVNRMDLDQAQQRLKCPEDMLNVSKSTNCIDKLLLDERNEFHRKIEEMTFQGGNSLPDLTTDKIMGKATSTMEREPKLTVKRQSDAMTVGLKIRKCVSTDDFRMQANCGRKRPEFTGPDFIMKSFVPPKQIDLSMANSDKHSVKRFINILLLNGRTIQVLCNAGTINTRQILEAIFRVESYEENYFLGLCVIIGGDFVFLPMDLKVHKVAPQGWTVAAQEVTRNKGRNAVVVMTEANVSLSLFIRVKFFLPTLRGLK